MFNYRGVDELDNVEILATARRTWETRTCRSRRTRGTSVGWIFSRPENQSLPKRTPKLFGKLLVLHILALHEEKMMNLSVSFRQKSLSCTTRFRAVLWRKRKSSYRKNLKKSWRLRKIQLALLCFTRQSTTIIKISSSGLRTIFPSLFSRKIK